MLNGVNFDVKKGEHLAIVGPSGAGKSTLTALILRFYDPTSGIIRMNGEDLRVFTADDVRSQIGLVRFEAKMFSSLWKSF